MLLLSTTLWRDHPALPCSVLGVLSIVIGYFLFRPLSWRQLLGRCPLFPVTGGALMIFAIMNLPEALQTVFERHLGHSIY
jgi:zinc transporter ZupT